jgi:hypothetical protein
MKNVLLIFDARGAQSLEKKYPMALFCATFIVDAAEFEDIRIPWPN